MYGRTTLSKVPASVVECVDYTGCICFVLGSIPGTGDILCHATNVVYRCVGMHILCAVQTLCIFFVSNLLHMVTKVLWSGQTTVKGGEVGN